MNKIILTIIAIIGATLPASAALVTTEKAGSLAASIDDPQTEITLTVSGPIDFSDLQFIAEQMPQLVSLDLSNATIESRRTPERAYAANEIMPGFFAGSPLESIVLPATEGLIIGEGAFAGSSLKSIIVPATVASVGNGAFAGSALTSATLNSTTKFGNHLFSDCDKLESVNLNGLTVLPAATFGDCTALANVDGAYFVTEIGDNCFRNDIALKQFNFGTGLKSIGTDAFNKSGLENADLTSCSELTVIGDWAFANNKSLRNVALPSSLTELGDGIFLGCSELATVQLPKDLTTLSDYAFTSDSNADIAGVLPEGITSVGDFALKGMDKVANVKFPSTLTYIGNNAMEGMTGLKTIDANDVTEVPELGSDVWLGVDQEKVELLAPVDMKLLYIDTPQWQDFYIDLPASIDAPIASLQKADLKARFVGTDLELQAKGTEILSVELFDTTGKLLTSVQPKAASTVINTSAWPTKIFIAKARLANGQQATAKLARN